MSTPAQHDLYLGDCRQVITDLDLRKVKAVITDPPYGIDQDTDYSKMGKNKNKYEKIEGDKFLELDLAFLLHLAPTQVIWGANYVPWILPVRPKMGWICWDKRGRGAFKAIGYPFELAYHSGTKQIIYRIPHGGYVNADGNRPRIHPTQKPVKLMRAVIVEFTQPGDLVLDPFMGSGSTGVACMIEGRDFIGIESVEIYYQAAAAEIKKARQQARLFN